MSSSGPAARRVFGYDLQGCDYWSQIVHGTRASIVIGIAVTVFALLISIVLGLVGGYYGGWLDAVISRLTDVFFGIPFVLGATVILVAFPDHGIWAMTLVLVVLGWTTMTRLMRGQVIAVTRHGLRRRRPDARRERPPHHVQAHPAQRHRAGLRAWPC